MAGKPANEIGCGFVEGFHRDDMVEQILRLKPSRRAEWFHPSHPPAKGQRVKVQISTANGDWAILTGQIDEISETTAVAIVERTSENEAIHEGPYRVVLTHVPSFKSPWVLSHAELMST